MPAQIGSLLAHLAAQKAQAGACALRQGHRRFHGRRAHARRGRRCGQVCCQLGSRRLLLLLLSLRGGFRGSHRGSRSDRSNGCCGVGLPHAAVSVEPGRRQEREREGMTCRWAGRQHRSGLKTVRSGPRLASCNSAGIASCRSQARHCTVQCCAVVCGLSLVDGPVLPLVPGPPAVQPLAGHPGAGINHIAAGKHRAGGQASRQASQ